MIISLCTPLGPESQKTKHVNSQRLEFNGHQKISVNIEMMIHTLFNQMAQSILIKVLKNKIQ